MSLAGELRARAADLGFLACGITDTGPVPNGDRLDAWLAKGYAGTMRYLHRQARRRKDPSLTVPEALSVVVLLENYYSPETAADRAAPRVAKYARGEDYHRVTLQRLGQLADFLLERGARVAHPWVDNGPIPERELARRAGLGWIGKNTMLIRPGAGSYCFIGTIFTDLPLPADPPFATDHCGTCTQCLDACPTGAFVEPHVLDATRCISYLTIEQKGPIAGDLAERMQGWAFGCDICNDVCPWNRRFAEPTTVAELLPRRTLAGVDETLFEAMDDAEFRRRFGDTPFERPGLAGMRRNVRAALASAHEEERRP
ncbi:MAG: tRNA epoxyqueuosine(34) reductase QueG [Gemmatimonadota bacterium]|nr:tRNA epoxyqueuosine(34) reductase QueG [Gemmatimonadales bacterium]MDQ3138264.1 tRNA epoxyqueuosine(34) reductase QueG [Gemmatimonadota bacterium]